MARLGFVIDLSNYSGPLGANAQCLVNQGCAGVIPRISLERPSMTEITVQQFQDAQAVQLATMGGYVWTYGQDVPEAVIDHAIQVIDPYTTYKILWMDVEDLQNFLRTVVPAIPPGPNYEYQRFGALPPRLRAVDQGRPSLSVLGPAQAVQWLQRAQAEAQKLNYLFGIYSAQYAWNPLTGASTAFSDVPWWVADADGNPDPTTFIPVGGTPAPVLKQYLISSQGMYICLPDPVDVSVVDLDRFSALFPTTPQDPCADLRQDLASVLGRANNIQNELTNLIADATVPS